MLGKLTIIILCGTHLAQCETNLPPTLKIYTGESFFLWCNLTTYQDLSAGFNIKWLRNGNQWCFNGISLLNVTKGECVNRAISLKDVYNPSGTQDFQLTVPNATLNDSGRHSCLVDVTSLGNSIRPDEFTLVNVTDPQSTTAQITTTSTTSIPSTLIASSVIPTDEQKPPSTKETIIAIGAGAGGGVLLVTIIVAVVCVKKKGKGNSTSDIDEKKSSFRKSNSFENNTVIADDKRKSNPLEKNAENLHYADLTLHDNPKSSSSKGTGSAKSKTLTVNPSDDRVEYAAVMAS